jgi:hypothetical protein
MVILLVRMELVAWEEALVSASAVKLWQLVLNFLVTGFALDGMDFAQVSTVEDLIFWGGGLLSVQ